MKSRGANAWRANGTRFRHRAGAGPCTSGESARGLSRWGPAAFRALESYAVTGDLEGLTGLFIYPGFRFKLVEGMITNFHMPRTTVLAMVMGFAGRELILAAYREAIRHRYRFLSYGDAMLIL